MRGFPADSSILQQCMYHVMYHMVSAESEKKWRQTWNRELSSDSESESEGREARRGSEQTSRTEGGLLLLHGLIFSSLNIFEVTVELENKKNI